MMRSHGKSAASYKLNPIATEAALVAAAGHQVDFSLNCGMAWLSDQALRLKREDGVTVNVSL